MNELGRPLIVDIRRGSLEDGPGIRSVVFFKGCPLRCIFCHNPEAQEVGPELAFAVERCIRCGACAAACPLGAIDLDSPARIDRGRCDLCGLCAEACPGGALRVIGAWWPVEQLAELLLRDLPFYRHSGGGVTLSGGECTLFPGYVESLGRTLKAQGIHIVLETSGQFDYGMFERQILPYLDLILFDMKLIDREASLGQLGRSNETILENLRRMLAQHTVEVRPRIPLIPGVTDSRENLAAIVDYLCSLGAREVSLVPYNPLGLAMYSRLGKPTPALSPLFMTPEEEARVVEMFREILVAHASASDGPCGAVTGTTTPAGSFC